MRKAVHKDALKGLVGCLLLAKYGDAILNFEGK